MIVSVKRQLSAGTSIHIGLYSHEASMASVSTTRVLTRCALDAFVNCGPYTAVVDRLGITCCDVRIASHTVEVEMGSDGVLTMLPTSPEMDATWCEYACAARDRHEQNMEVFVDDTLGGRTAVRTTRAVLRGEELFVWFEHSLARQCHIPILTPANIRGKEEYLCTSCGAVFQRPNPLKSHIRYHCSSVHTSTSVTLHTASGCSSSINANFPMLLPASSPSPWCTSWLPRFPAVWSASPLVLAASRDGNHRAVTSYAGEVTGNTVGAEQSAGSWWLQYLQQILRVDNSSAARTGKLRDVTGYATSDVTNDVTTRAATVERTKTMTSSELVDGRAKRSGGYVCPYCGKLYSRRYGLKIHVRTHTGFKPLRCAVCGRPFGDPSNLNKHVRLHSEWSAAGDGDSAPYRCRQCGKVLVRRRDLDRHVRARHPDQLRPSSADVSQHAADVVMVTSSECVSASDRDDQQDCRSADETKIAT